MTNELLARIDILNNENKQLKEELKSANEEITWWSNRFNAVERDNRQLKQQLEYLRSNEYLNQVKWERTFNEELVKDLQQRIDKANEILSNILVVKRSDGNYGAVKNTRKKEVYEAICMLNEILETPHRTNYNLLGDKE